MLARDLMTPHPYCVNARTPVSRIMHAMLDHGISAVMVTDDDGALVGLVSEGDLVRRQDSAHQKKLDHWLALLAEGEALNLEFLHSLQLGERTAASVMSSPVIAVDELAPLSDIADLLIKHGIKRVPVVRKGKLLGVVSRRDILRALLAQEAQPAPGAEAS
ncbi:CBS domain-containing protein [Streptomyces cavourensis]|jgi:CBS domain-containing protein|nr:CBS domain-containing protein [Streptomyces cavourensis]